MKKVIAAASVSLLPLFAFAQDLSGIQTIVESIGNIISTLIPIVFAIILLVFFWGLARYVLAAGDEEQKVQGRKLMVGGVIALFVAASVWGIVIFVQNIVGINSNPQNIGAPGVNY